MDLGPNASFIVASYAATALVIGALILWVLLDYSLQRRALRDLEARVPGRR